MAEVVDEQDIPQESAESVDDIDKQRLANYERWKNETKEAMMKGEEFVPKLIFLSMIDEMDFEKQGRDPDKYTSHAGLTARKEWSSRLLGCRDPEGCCHTLTKCEMALACLCPCYISAKIRYHYDGSEDTLFNMCCLWNPFTMRALVRSGYYLKGSCCGDCVASAFCFPCSLGQTLAEVRQRPSILAERMETSEDNIQLFKQECRQDPSPWVTSKTEACTQCMSESNDSDSEGGEACIQLCCIMPLQIGCIGLSCCAAGQKITRNVAPHVEDMLGCCWMPLPLARNLTRQAMSIEGSGCADVCCSCCFPCAQKQLKDQVLFSSLGFWPDKWEQQSKPKTPTMYDYVRVGPVDLEWEAKMEEEDAQIKQHRAEMLERLRQEREEQERKMQELLERQRELRELQRQQEEAQKLEEAQKKKNSGSILGSIAKSVWESVVPDPIEMLLG
jgi:hypothetical protein